MLKQLIYSLMAVALLVSCGSSKDAAASNYRPAERATDPDTILVDQALNLADYLQRAPGLQVRYSPGNTTVSYRGQAPLYVINGLPIGYNYEEANAMVIASDINSVQVLDAIEATARFGRRGGRGAILIQTY